MTSSLPRMMIKEFVFCVSAFGLVASMTTPVPNLCPQPKDPPAFQYAHPNDCTQYFTCSHGQAYQHQCINGTRWSAFYETCVFSFSHYDSCTRENAQRECSRNATDLIPHPTSCQRYYNCSDTAQRYWRSFFEPYEDECPYPQLFDVMEKKCLPFTQAFCGPFRNASKDVCDYLRYRCPVAHCRPCRVDYPSCVGLKDGFQDYPDRPWTRFFFECEFERIISVSTCGLHDPTETQAIFSPVKKKCVSVWEVPRSEHGLAPSCDDKPAGWYRTRERADVYYTCPGAEVSYCPAGEVLDEGNGPWCKPS